MKPIKVVNDKGCILLHFDNGKVINCFMIRRGFSKRLGKNTYVWYGKREFVTVRDAKKYAIENYSEFIN